VALWGNRRPRGFGGRLVRLGLWCLVGLAAWVLYLDRSVRQGFREGHWRDPVRFYAAPRRISVGLELDKAGVKEDLDALGYRAVSRAPDEPGTYRRAKDALDIHLRAAPSATSFGDGEARQVHLALEGGRVRKIVDAEEGPVGAFELEPRPLEGLYDGHWTRRRELRLADVPPHVVDAVLAAEDARFLDHFGVDPASLMRAVQVNWRAGTVRQGGSTITQQLVKNHFLSPERTIWRKLREIPMSLILEARYSKQEILEAYLATVYLGHDRLVGIHGLAEGAWVYFGKSVKDLTLGEGATLAGMIRAPNVYTPLRHRERALKRRNDVLSEMQDLGWISAAEEKKARAEPAGRPRARQAASDAYFVQHATRELAKGGVAVDRLATGSEIFTTLDARLQEIVSTAVAESKSLLGKAQVAVVAIDPIDGSIRALVGGRDYLESQFDRATRARRPVGSLWKPFVVLAAIADPSSGITAATKIEDGPLKVSSGAKEWVPQNSDDRYHGEVSVRQALARSLNVPTVRLAQHVGIERLAEFGDRLGIREEPLPRLPAMALGAFEASLLDMTAAYSIFPGGGLRVEPFAIAAVKAPSGVALHQTEPREHVATSPAAAFVVHSMLEDVVRTGTARGVARAGLRGAIAGKTGTSNDQRDAWFVGYTPSLLLGVWVGYDDDRPLRGGGAEIAVPLWTRIARQALAGAPPETFQSPGGVEEVALDAGTGLRAGPGCGPAVREVFVAGTAPEESCGKDTPPATQAAAASRRDVPARLRALFGEIVADVSRLMRHLLERDASAPAGG